MEGMCLTLRSDGPPPLPPRCPSPRRACCDIFPTVEYGYTAIPTYPSGQIGFMLLSNAERGEWPWPTSQPAS